MLKAKFGAGGVVRSIALGALVAAGALPGVSAWAQPAPPGMEHGMGRMGHHMGGHMFDASPERIGRVVDHLLDGLNANDAQRAQIKQIAAAAAADLKGQREAGRALRERGLQVFTAPNVDANAAEQVRQQMLALHEQTSRRVLQAMLDVSRVLTPEQRAKIGERIRERAARMQERRERMDRLHRMQPPDREAPRR